MKNCLDCEKQQQAGDFERSMAVMMVGEGNLLVIGCAVHLAELVAKLGAKRKGTTKADRPS